MKHLLIGAIRVSMSLLLIATGSNAKAQHALPVYRVGICAPLYLDSAFQNKSYRFQKEFPRFLLPGLDFIQGARIGLDSMPLYQVKIEANFFDIKSARESVDSLLITGKLDSLQLMIGSVRDEDFKKLAHWAKAKQVPFISVTYPNDGGITANPFVAIANPTLKSHCEFIYRNITEMHKRENLILVRRSGTQEDRVAGYFQSVQSAGWGSNTRFKTFLTDSNFNDLKNRLDSTKLNVLVGGSLDQEFAVSLAHFASGMSKKYRIKLIGMPNWKGFQGLINPKKTGIADLPIYLSSEFYQHPTDSFSLILQDAYLKRFKGKPSEFAYKGFESVYVFVKLLSSFPVDFMNHINEFPYRVFTDFEFKPVRVSESNPMPDYFENKHLQWLKIQKGLLRP